MSWHFHMTCNTIFKMMREEDSSKQVKMFRVV
jgi:hypothetical protein